MTKFKIRETTTKGAELVEFWLEGNVNNSITLYANAGEKTWSILHINKYGVWRTSDLDESLGFELDDDNQIRIDN